MDDTLGKIMQFSGRNRLFNDDFYAYDIAYDNLDISNSSQLRYDTCISATKKMDAMIEKYQWHFIGLG